MEVKHIPESRRFQLLDEKGNHWGEMTYTMGESVMNINHVGVHPAHQGEGLGDVLVKAGIEYAQKENISIHPICSFAAKFFSKNKSEYEGLLK